MKNLILEVNKKFIKDNNSIHTGNVKIMFTPDINKDYWKYRVMLHKDQAIVGFPKFTLTGIGFAIESDWNTNLPSDCDADHIYDHIKCNKKYKAITKEMCVEGIKMIQSLANKE